MANIAWAEMMWQWSWSGVNIYVNWVTQVKDTEGKILNVFGVKYTDGYTYPAIAYRSSTQKILGNLINTSNYNSGSITIPSKSVNVPTSGLYAKYSLFNSTKGLGVFVLDMQNTGSSNPTGMFGMAIPDDSQFYQYRNWAYAFEHFSYSSTNFWNLVEAFADGKYAFELDSSTTGGADGDYEDNYTDDIELVSDTDLNQNSLSSTKFVTTYMLTIPQMNDLGNKLWGILSALGNSVLKPQDFIISCCMIPYTSGGSTKLIKAGWILLDGAEGKVIEKQFVRLSCGTLNLPEKWGSAIDYQTQISIILPFIGERQLSAQEFIGGQIKVDYTIDLISGACVASITAIRGDLNSVLYQFTGNCAAQIPITSQDFSRLLGGIGIMAQSGSGSMNGSSTANITSKTGDRTKETDTSSKTESSQSSRNSGVNSNLNFAAFAPQCGKTGDLSRTVGFMTIRKPYLVLRRPIQSLPDNFKHYKGYVSNITAQLSTLNGYTEVGFCNLSVPSATDTELMEIRALLTSGVII